MTRTAGAKDKQPGGRKRRNATAAELESKKAKRMAEAARKRTAGQQAANDARRTFFSTGSRQHADSSNSASQDAPQPEEVDTGPSRDGSDSAARDSAADHGADAALL